MLVIILLVFLILFFISMRCLKDIVSQSIAFFFLFYWGVSLVLSNLGLFNLFDVRTSTYLYFLLGVSAFILGMAAVERREKNFFPYAEKISKDLAELALNKFFIVAQIVLTVYLAKYAILSMAIAKVSGKGAMQGGDVAAVLRTVPYLEFIYSVAGNITFNITCPLLMYLILRFQKKYIPRIILCLLFIAVFAIINGGRSLFVIAALYFVITYTCVNKQQKFSFSKEKIIATVILIAVSLVGISFMTQYRDRGNFEVDLETFSESISESGEKVGLYSTLPFVMFDYALKQDYLQMFDGYQFGRATFAGFDIYVTGVLKTFGFDLVNTNVKITHYLQETWVPITNKNTANYAYTGILQHYLDFGLFGIFIFPFVFGLITRYLVFKVQTTGNVFIFLFLSFAFFMAIHSVFTCYFIKTWPYWYFAFLLIGYLKTNQNNRV